MLSPVILGVFGMNVWWKVHRAEGHFQQLLSLSLPKDTAPDLIRIRAMSDFIPMLLDWTMILIAFALFVFFVVTLLVHDPKEKLLLKIAEEMESREE